MSDERMIRIDNLRLLLKQEQWTQAHLAALMDVTPQYIGKLLNKKTAFTEKTARRIEEIAQRPRNWLDAVHHASKDAYFGKQGDHQNQKVGDSGHVYPIHAGASVANLVMEPVTFATNTPRAPVVEWATLDVELTKPNRECGCGIDETK